MTDGASSCIVTANVGAVRQSGKSNGYPGNQTSHTGQGSEVGSKHDNGTDRQKYRRCGQKHGYNERPAWGKTCGKCHLKHYFQSFCKKGRLAL